MSSGLDQAINALNLVTRNIDVDRSGFDEALQAEGIDPDTVVATTVCSFGRVNIEANVDADTLTIIHYGGRFSSLGRRKTFGGGIKYNAPQFKQCRAYGPAEHTDHEDLASTAPSSPAPMTSCSADSNGAGKRNGFTTTETRSWR
ncbi:hypothetical protein [Fodinicola acaciae]|uniref:hypothetical protein n=1 Tax=Fodinicola acaciae TaxID=2681555 RepID=UPI0013D692D8|nr:hypothetical protein [Fodinicola acaciae]